MRHIFISEHIDESAFRMQGRAGHIYILFTSLLSLLAYKCELSANGLKKYAGCCIPAEHSISGLIMIFAFFLESDVDTVNRSLTKSSAILSIAAIGLLFLNEVIHLLMKKNRTE